jgi:hypothetical protein
MVVPRIVKQRASTAAMLDPKAREKLELAAEAAGLTQAQLVDLVRDSGALSLPPDEEDGVTFPITLKELGYKLHNELQAIPGEDRGEWFKGLLEPQQVALVVACNDKRYRPEVIAKDLGLSAHEVRHLINLYADRVGAQVTQIRLSTIAGHVQLAAERAMEGLLEKGDFKGYFGIQKDVVGILQSLGIIDQAIHRVEVTHRMGDNERAEIEAMLEVERKKERRLEEIKRVEITVTDTLPDKLPFEKLA